MICSRSIQIHVLFQNVHFPSLQVRQRTGVETNHAYSLMKCFEEKLDNGQAIRLVQIRNPWGFAEWKGDWADFSKGTLPECWEKNPELKKRLKA